MAQLDELGYVDTNGDGFREMPGGGDNIVLRHAVNTDSDLGGAVGELWSNWMNAIGIEVQLDAYDQDQLFGVIVDGTYDTFYWGWVPFVDPDPMLSYFTEPTSWATTTTPTGATSASRSCTSSRSRRSTRPAAFEIVHEMVRILYDNAGYPVLWYAPDLQAYRTDRFEGFVQQPADVGPVIFSQSSPSYAAAPPDRRRAQPAGRRR